LAKSAFDQAISGLDKLPEASYSPPTRTHRQPSTPLSIPHHACTAHRRSLDRSQRPHVSPSCRVVLCGAEDSTLIMQLLRDNLTLWTSESQQGGGEDEDEDGMTVQDVADDD
jgi:hypothetical protein